MWWGALSFFVVLVLMEPYSAWVHRALWHGPLWVIHRTHHRDLIHTGKPQGLVLNDLLSATHAPVSMALIVYGALANGTLPAVALGAGLGMTAYGALYVLFHDGMVHHRLPVTALERVPMFAAMKHAHAVHHKTNAAPYGFFASAALLERDPLGPEPKEVRAA
jgi:beta-carotene 3-hydroxylase